MASISQFQKLMQEHKNELRDTMNDDEIAEALLRQRATPEDSILIREALGITFKEYVEHMIQPDPWEITEHIHSNEKNAQENPDETDSQLAQIIPYKDTTPAAIEGTRWFMNKLAGCGVNMTIEGGRQVIPMMSIYVYNIAMIPREEWSMLTLYFPKEAEDKDLKPETMPVEERPDHFYMSPLMVDFLTRAVLEATNGQWLPGGMHGRITSYTCAGIRLADDDSVLLCMNAQASDLFAGHLKRIQQEPSPCYGTHMSHLAVDTRTHTDALLTDMKLRSEARKKRDAATKDTLLAELARCDTGEPLPKE